MNISVGGNRADRGTEARHVGAAQEGLGVSAAALSRELRAVGVRRLQGFQARRSWSAATAATSIARRSRSILRMAAANGFGRVLVGRGGIAVHAGRILRHPQARRASAASSCRPATIPAGRTAISASSTTSATAARRRSGSPRRSIARHQDDPRVPHRSTRRTSTSTGSEQQRSATWRSRSSIRSPTTPR